MASKARLQSQRSMQVCLTFFYLLPAKIFHHTNIWLSYCQKSKFCPYLTSVECLNYIGFASQIRINLCFKKVTQIGKKLMIFEKIQFCNFYTWSKLSIWCEKYITSMKKDFYLIIKQHHTELNVSTENFFHRVYGCKVCL